MVVLVIALMVCALAAAAAFVVHAVRAQRWWVQAIEGTKYFGLTSSEKRAFESEMKERTRSVVTLGTLVAKLKTPRPPIGVEVRGTTAPPQCRPADFARAMRYDADERDVFVATQMKCGTTWMQQIVYETLLKGQGDLSDAGSRHIYAVSPWIEASWAVPMDEAPRLGQGGRRLIKTHMPTKLLPISPRARYIYVTRHPAACFASCADFITMLMGPLMGSRAALLELVRQRADVVGAVAGPRGRLVARGVGTAERDVRALRGDACRPRGGDRSRLEIPRCHAHPRRAHGRHSQEPLRFHEEARGSLLDGPAHTVRL